MLAEEHVKNLDGTFPDDLRQHAQKLRTLDLDGEDAATRDLLVRYAETKAKAMEERAACNIPEALLLEGDCDMYYAMLPRYARW